jgi:hypothetical protein
MATSAFFASGFLPCHFDKMKPPFFAWQDFFSPWQIALVMFIQSLELLAIWFAFASPWPSLWRMGLELSGVARRWLRIWLAMASWPLFIFVVFGSCLMS